MQRLRARRREGALRDRGRPPAHAADLRVRPPVRPPASRSAGSRDKTLPDVSCPLSLLSGSPVFGVAVRHPTWALLAPEGSTKLAPRCLSVCLSVWASALPGPGWSVLEAETEVDAFRSFLFPMTSGTPVTWSRVFYSSFPYVCGGQGVTHTRPRR